MCKKIWQRAGFRVTAIALAGVVAEKLQDETGIESTTIAMRLMQLNRRANWLFHHKRQIKRFIGGKRTYFYPGREFSLTPKDILIVEEAGMVGTRLMADIIRYAREGGAKVVLVGDRGQLQPINAGGPFATIADITDTAELKHVVRQKLEPWDPNPAWHRQLGQLVAAGHSAQAIKLLDERGRLNVLDDREQAMLSLVLDWSVGGVGNPLDHLILAGTREEVTRLNAMCQDARRRMSATSPVAVPIGDQEFRVGDVVIFKKNSKTLHVQNGSRGTILSFNRLRGTIAVQLHSKNRKVVIPYRSYQEIALGYASTTHAIQGGTVPNIYVLLGGSLQDRHLSYVQASRASESTRFYVDKYHAGRGNRDLIRDMDRKREKLLAVNLIEQVAGPDEEPTDGPEVGPAREANSSQTTSTERYEQLIDELRVAAGRQTRKPGSTGTASPTEQATGFQSAPVEESQSTLEPIHTATDEVVEEEDSATRPIAEQQNRPVPGSQQSQPIAPAKPSHSYPAHHLVEERAPRKRNAPKKSKPSVTSSRDREQPKGPQTASGTTQAHPATPNTHDASDLSHVQVESTTDIRHLNQAVARYGKLPGGIVIEGEVICDFPIRSIAVDARHPTQLLINDSLRFETKLTPIELAILWQAVLIDGDARTNFGVISQTKAIGLDSTKAPAVTMMTADDYLGSIVYGYNSHFTLRSSKIAGYKNPFIEEVESIFNEQPLFERQAINCAYELNPRIFATIHGMRMSALRAGVLSPASTAVTLAIGVVRQGEVTDKVPYQCKSGELVESQFPFVWAAFNRLKRSFPEYASAEPSVIRTIHYAETVLVLRRALADRALRRGDEHIERLAKAGEQVPNPRFDYSLRSPQYTELVRKAARRLSAYDSAPYWDWFMAALLGSHYAKLAGDSVPFAMCKRRAMEIMTTLRRVELHGREKLARALADRFSAIAKGLHDGCHDMVLDNCFRIGVKPGTRNPEAYLRDALHLCNTTADLNSNVYLRCMQAEIRSRLEDSYDPLPELTRLRKENPSDRSPYVCLANIANRRFLARVEKDAPRAPQVPAITDREELYRFGVSLEELNRKLQSHTDMAPSFALAHTMYEKLRLAPITAFFPEYLHRHNPFVFCHELLDFEDAAQLEDLRQPFGPNDGILGWASGPNRVREYLSKKAPWAIPKHAATIWAEIVETHRSSPKSRMSKTLLLLDYELHARKRSLYALTTAMAEHRIINPQAALFWLDCHPEFGQPFPSPSK